MKPDIDAIISRAKSRELSESDAFMFQNAVLYGNVPTPRLVEFFTALDDRRLGEEEFRGFFKASLESIAKVSNSEQSLDTCGTGGDKSGSFNISTAAGILLAALNVPVAKHGNRAASSKCGSADVLEALGVKLGQTPERAAAILKECGFVFLFARAFHPAFRHATEARTAFGERTYFNFLGPLLNPARARFRVHGLSDFSYAEILGRVLLDSGVERAFFIRAENGMDEASPFSDTEVLECVKGKDFKKFTLPTSKYATGRPEELLGGDVTDNARILRNIFNGKGTDTQNMTVALNAALGLVVFGHADTFEAGVEISLEALSSEKAAEKLFEIVATSNA